MRQIRVLFILTFLSAIPFTSFGQVSEIQEFVLENGLKILLLENHKSPAVTFQVWYRVGSRNEKDGKSGLSHLLEHMMFKGTPTVNPEEYSRIIARNGGRSNAFTSSDTTVYFATMSREKIGIAIDLEADRMANALLNGTYFDAEQQVVMEERRLRTEDDPTSALGEVTGAVAFLVHPYRRPVIGWMKDLQGLTPEDLKSFYRTFYVPNNAFVVAVGDFSTQEMLAKIKSAFGKIPKGPEPPKVTIEEPPQKGERRVNFKKEAELPFILIYYQAPNFQNPDSFALDLLTVILAGGRSSRLYREIVYKKRLTRAIDADYNGLSVDPTLFSITAQVMPGKKSSDTEEAIYRLLDQLMTEPVPDKELQKAKNQVEAAFVFGQDSISRQARRIGWYELAADWRLLKDYLPGIRKVTAEDVMRVVKKYLQRDQRTVGTLIPIQRKKP